MYNINMVSTMHGAILQFGALKDDDTLPGARGAECSRRKFSQGTSNSWQAGISILNEGKGIVRRVECRV